MTNPQSNADINPQCSIKHCQGIKDSQQGKASWLLLLFIGAIIITAITALTFGYKIGQRKGYHTANVEATTLEDGQALTAENIKSIRLENDVLKQQLTSAQEERDISLANLTDLRQEQSNLKVINLQLQQVNEVLKKQLAKQGGLPLSIVGFEIAPLPDNIFEYRFDVAMVSEDANVKTLTPTLTLLNSTSLVEVPLEPRYYKINGVARIRGRFMMPKGFRPAQIKLNLMAGGQKLEQIYNWHVGKKMRDMPLSLSDVPEADQRPVGMK